MSDKITYRASLLLLCAAVTILNPIIKKFVLKIPAYYNRCIKGIFEVKGRALKSDLQPLSVTKIYVIQK